MPVSNTDIILYGAANMPEDDTSTAGGAIDRTIKVLNVDMGTAGVGGTDKLNVVSSSTGDVTQTLTVTGRDATGAVKSQAYSLAGTTTQSGTQAFERVLKIIASATHSGTITVSHQTSSSGIATLEGTVDAPGGTAVLQSRRPFYDAIANATGDGDKELYEKIFVSNTHATLSLNSASLALTSDGTSSNIIDFDLENTVTGVGTITNRQTAPGAAKTSRDTWSDVLLSVPGDSLGPLNSGSDHVGVWIQMDLNAGTAAENVSITLQVSGNST